jgi:hypothetical protein
LVPGLTAGVSRKGLQVLPAATHPDDWLHGRSVCAISHIYARSRISDLS